ncbi:MAG: LysM peptidoglycan-binding protein, partial [Noviherbaspirillum sp.]|nr:LysM peptidoglycan-binding protein [Noviherbaspirillum sp.]
YMPHPPEKQIDARIVSIYGGVRQAGQNQIVTVNRGRNDGIDIGTVLELSRFGAVIPDRTDNKNLVKLPDYQYGNLFVFRVFNNISYGLVMQVTDSVQIGDTARSPE